MSDETETSTFTQADIDRIIKDRLERERAKYADYDALKARVAAIEEQERQQVTGRNQEESEIKALEARVAEAERARDEALAQSRERLLRAEVTAAAAAKGFAYPGDVVRLADLSGVSIDDAGQVDGVLEALDRLASERPDYLRRTPAPGIDGGASGPAGDDLPRLTPAQERVAREMGVSLDAYARRLAQTTTK